MTFLKIVAVALLYTLTPVFSSLIAAPLAVPAAFRYTQVAPPSVLPFSAQVSTFTRNLHVFDAPYAAGVIPGPPAIVQRTVLPPVAAPLVPRLLPAAAPLVPRALPAPFAVPWDTRVLPAATAGYPYPAGLIAAARGIHHGVAPAPLLG